MKAVGLRELKNRLSEYIRDVKRGERILVTDRGEVVAELAAPGTDRGPDLPSAGHALAAHALAAQGLATPGQANRTEAYPERPRVMKPGRAAALLALERGER